MPRRAVASATPNRASSNVSFRDASILPIPDATYNDNIATLRRQWKWAAFSQFFYTFDTLLAMPDVTLTDVEDDLARGTALYLPRVMQRLLYTLTQDRKINIDNWQSALRKQYLRRDPEANPLGIEPPAPSRKHSREPTVFSEPALDPDHVAKEDESVPHTPQTNTAENEASNAEPSSPAAASAATPQKTEDEGDTKGRTSHNEAVKMEDGVGEDGLPQPDEPKDWFDLSLFTRLDSLHLLTEWQFQNPHRLRQIMKDDGDAAQWRHEPIGYDAKTNAYWLIGPDRLWIQRVPPKPPRTNRKRKAPPKKTPAKASTSKATEAPESDSESEIEQSPSKRRRTSGRATSGRATRSKAKEAVATTSGRGTRAAKVQADKKLAAQAKELAEQTRSHAAAITQASTPTRHSLGTRASARLRGASTYDDDDEWQQIPDEWLKGTVDSPGHETQGRSQRKTRARKPVEEEEEADEEDEDKELKHLAEQAGLESDGESSVLTELSDEQSLEAAEDSEKAPVTAAPLKDTTTPKRKETKKKEEQLATPAETDQKPSEEVQDHIPPGFVEWEAVCVTLYEWEHVADQFEKATHYLEKALYKVLSQNIVPIVTEELKAQERKRKMDEALVHRKRSSRIAMKEIEKEEARAAAQKKAEEDEKMARVRRAEARAKKEEAEREKREKAREQRRLEREERERLKQEQQEREAAEVDVVTQEPPSKAPPVNGSKNSRHSTARHTSRDTPSGVRSPDWILDCEICHKSGVNVDDGTAMVSCNSCQRWQHIRCHDLADRQAGRPPRDWTRQPFFCQRCRPTHSRLPNGTIHPPRPIDQYTWTQPQSQKTLPPPPQHPYVQPTSDVRYSQYSNYESGSPYPQQYMQSRPVPQGSYPRPQGNITFSHYQPEQGGFSRTSQQPLIPSTPAWQGNYPAANGMPSRSQQPIQLPPPQPYGQNGMYSGGRVTPSYQYQSSSQQPYSNGVPDAVSSSTNGSWASVPSDYYPSASNAGQLSASQLNAAESLAYMQRSGRHGWPNGAAQPSQNNGYPPSAHLPSMAPHHYPPS
ncbi:hypothetical protein NM688_g348 [Phlebia brevispora]|uniref:Uncharacterized protein n=1 Tax=Phlebia brevispora TaxID=194682 RepID=A0ACC1TE88_9APHY|nr:hypothetical protein NM688_g348 [Phlebia brevispora]